MNLLAHALVARATLPDREGQTCSGALMADYFTGERLEDYPEGLRLGIAQHRAVDAFTDAHPAFIRTRRTLAASGAPRFTAGILTDIFWDHVLASEWETYGLPLSSLGLEAFCASVYERLGRTRAHHSPAFARAYEWIVGLSWLARYADVEGVRLTLEGVQGRMSGRVDLAACVPLLEALRAELREGFADFWPELLDFSRAWAEEAGGARSDPYR